MEEPPYAKKLALKKEVLENSKKYKPFMKIPNEIHTSQGKEK